MTNHAEITIDNDVLRICGDLDFSNAMSIYQKSLEAFSSPYSMIVIDFSGVKSTNSAAVALIINWMRHAHKTDKSIMFRDLSADIMSVAKASGLDKLIAPLMS